MDSHVLYLVAVAVCGLCRQEFTDYSSKHGVLVAMEMEHVHVTDVNIMLAQAVDTTIAKLFQHARAGPILFARQEFFHAVVLNVLHALDVQVM